MAITTKDLAQLCGVSRTTIHRALNGTGRIKPETKEMILQVAKEHGYRPDLLATGLAKGQTYNIGVVVLDVKNRYFAQMLSTISTEAYARGYGVNITLHGGDAGTEREQLTRLADYRLTGSSSPRSTRGRRTGHSWSPCTARLSLWITGLRTASRLLGSTSGQQCGRQCRERQRRAMSASCLSARR